MKNAAYVQAVTSAYRAALENRQYSESNLAAVFSRSGFTKGILTGSAELDVRNPYRRRQNS
jgi:collagenase-like PrtC family protease